VSHAAVERAPNPLGEAFAFLPGRSSVGTVKIRLHRADGPLAEAFVERLLAEILVPFADCRGPGSEAGGS
jgi:hypothetical protein